MRVGVQDDGDERWGSTSVGHDGAAGGVDRVHPWSSESTSFWYGWYSMLLCVALRMPVSSSIFLNAPELEIVDALFCPEHPVFLHFSASQQWHVHERHVR